MANDSTYYPSWKLRLTIRLDEFGAGSRLTAAPKKITKNLNGTKAPRAVLNSVLDPGAPDGVKRYLLLPQGQTTAAAAQNQARSADGLTFDLTIIPTELDVSLNGIRTADTMTASFRFADCPIDPRVVRMCAVEAFIGTVSPDEYQAGVEGKRRNGPAAAGQGESMNLVQDTYLDASGKQRTNSRFLGWVDKWVVEWGEKEPSVRIECRDTTQLLMEVEMPPSAVLDMTKPIDQSIALFLSMFPRFQGLSVEYRPNTGTPPILNKVLSHTAYRPNLGPPSSRGGGSDEKFTVWDYLTDVCRSIGHSIFLDGTIVVVQNVRSLTTKASVHRPDDPYQGRTLDGGRRAEYRQLIYGRNIKELRISRNYAKNAPANIEVRSYSTAKKNVLVARFPLAPDRQKYALPGDAQSDQKWLVLNVSGIEDQGTLNTIAQTTYESIGRNELHVELKTHNLASFGGGNLDPDILDMRSGDTFEVLAQRDEDEQSTTTKIEKELSAPARGALFLERLGFSDDFARAYTKAYADAGFLAQFRLKQLKISCSIDQGISLDMVGMNFIEVRADKSLPAGQEPPVATAKSKGRNVNGQ